MEDKEIIKLFDKTRTREKAFNHLVDKYTEKVYWHCRRMLIDHEDTNDVVQNIFIKIYTNLDKFKGNSELYTWIYSIARNETYSFLKQKNKVVNINFDTVSFKLENKLTDDNWYNGDQVETKLQKAILKLPEKQREVFNYRYYQDLSYEDIHKITDTSVGALKASYFHAVKKIKENLDTD